MIKHHSMFQSGVYEMREMFLWPAGDFGVLFCWLATSVHQSRLDRRSPVVIILKLRLILFREGIVIGRLLESMW